MQAAWFKIEIEMVSKVVASMEERRQAMCQAQGQQSLSKQWHTGQALYVCILSLNQRTPDFNIASIDPSQTKHATVLLQKVANFWGCSETFCHNAYV